MYNGCPHLVFLDVFFYLKEFFIPFFEIFPISMPSRGDWGRSGHRVKRDSKGKNRRY
jgi:hypothetical protein